MKRIIASILALIVSPAYAQGIPVPAPINTALYALKTSIPTPSTTVTSAPATNGAVGTSTQYVPADAAQKHTVQRANTTVDANCNWTVTFGQTFTSSSPVIHASVIVASPTQPMPCIVATRSSTVQTGKCFLSQTTVLSLSNVTAGFTLSPFGSTCTAGTPVMVVGAEPTQ